MNQQPAVQKTPEDHAKTTSSDDLKKFISNPDADPQLVQVAKKELIARGEQAPSADDEEKGYRTQR